MPSTFLTIPPEIRDIIIEGVICSERLAPVNPAEAACTRQDRITTWRYENNNFATWRNGPLHVLFEKPDSYSSNAISLRLCNAQLNEEVASAIARLGDETRRYKLDVLFVDERELWPTWTSVPVLTERVEEVHVTFRIFGNRSVRSTQTGRRKHRSDFTPGDGSPPQVVWCFYYLLEYFLRRGPVLGLTGRGRDRQVSVKVLNLNFVAGEGQVMFGETEQANWWRVQRGQVQLDRDDMRIMRPQWLADALVAHITGLLHMGYHTAKYGGILHERVGKIRVCVEGTFLFEYDIGSILSVLAHNDPLGTFGHISSREDRVPRFREWKKKAERCRLERGLSVPQPLAENEKKQHEELGDSQ